MQCNFCENEGRYVCDYLGAGGTCSNHMCRDHATPEFEDVTLEMAEEAYTLCPKHKKYQVKPKDKKTKK